jgi:hypothetical protein
MSEIKCAFCKGTGTGKDPFNLLSELATCKTLEKKEKRIKADLKETRRLWREINKALKWRQFLP